MTRTGIIFAVFVCVITFALASCAPVNTYPEPSQPVSRPAEQPPKPVSDHLEVPALPGEEVLPQQEPLPEVYMPEVDNLPPVKAAILLPLSGKHKTLGESMLKAAQMAVFDTGHAHFQLMPRDTLGTPEGARAAAQNAVKDGAQIILGPVFSESVKAVKPVAGSANVNVVAFSTDWAVAGGNVFTMGFLPFDQVDRVLHYAAANNFRRVAVIAPDTAYGQAVVSAYKRRAAHIGIHTPAIKLFSPQITGFDFLVEELITEARNAGGGFQDAATRAPFDAVFLPVASDMAEMISDTLTRKGFSSRYVKRLGTGLLDDSQMFGSRALNGIWFAAPSPDSRRFFERRFLEAYGYSAPRLSTLAYDATALAATLAKRGLVQNGRPAYDQASIKNPNGFAGVDGIFRFSPQGTGERGLAILEIKGGRIRVLDPAPSSFQSTANF